MLVGILKLLPESTMEIPQQTIHVPVQPDCEGDISNKEGISN